MFESNPNNLPEVNTPENQQSPMPSPRPRRKERNALAESFFVQYGFKFILGLVIIVVFLTVVQCDIKKPESPTWTTNLTVPMMSRTYEIPEIIDKIDQPGIAIEGDSTIVFNYSADIDSFTIDTNELKVDDLSFGFGETIGSVDIDIASPASREYVLTDLVTVLHGVIPGVDFDIYYDLPQFTEYDWATVATGGFYLVIVNDLGVDLSVVEVDIIDRYFVRSITQPQATFPSGIPNGSKDSIFIDFSGQTVSAQIGVDIHCETPGGTILTLDDKKMESTVKSTPLTVTSAQAVIPEIERDFSTTAQIVNNNTVYSAEISYGTATIDIANGTEMQSDLTLLLPDFTQGSLPLTRNVLINGNQSQQINIDLSGYTFEPLDQIYPQDIICSAMVVIRSSAPAKVVLENTDNVQIDVTVNNLSFESITGTLHSAEAQLEDIQLEIDLPRGFDEIQLVNAELTLEIENAFGLDGDLAITVDGDNGQQIIIDTTVSPGTISSPSITIVTNDNIASFFNPVPGEITVSGVADFSGDGSVTEDDYVFATIAIRSPMELMIDSATFDGDMSSEEIDQSDIDLITDHVLGAQLTSVIQNHLPLGASVDIHLGGDSLTVLSDPELVISLSVDAGTTDINGNVITATESQNIVTLDDQEIKILENPILYTTQVITLNSTNGQAVKVNLDDYIEVSGIIEVEYHFDGEF